MPVVIDGYNLLHARGDGPSAASRARLVHDLVRWAGLRQRRVVIVFDAWAQGERVEREEAHGPVTVCFTRYGERADDRIVRWVSGRREAVVVTSDRVVRQAARRRGAAVIDSDAFAARLDAALEEEAATDAERAPATPSRRHAGREAAWLRGL